MNPVNRTKPREHLSGCHSQELKNPDRSSVRRYGRKLSYLILGVLCWLGNYFHVSTSFERDRFFSHLSDLEREMSFRSEMGLYYFYYKRIVEAPSFLSGIYQLTKDNLTEYPSEINVLGRFNLYPEVLIGGLFRLFKLLPHFTNIEALECYTVHRDSNEPPVTSCVGMEVPIFFYLEVVWVLSGFTASLLFVYGCLLSGSLMGGTLTALSFFFNHSECTRVQWTPPLRETFAYPFILLHFLTITTYVQQSNNDSGRTICVSEKHVRILMMATSFAVLVLWQFSQFVLVCETTIFLFMYICGNISRSTFRAFLQTLTVGHILAIFGLMGNSMLVFSFFSTILLSSWLLLLFDRNVQSSFCLKSFMRMGCVLSLSFLLKSCVPGGNHDSHIIAIFLSKIDTRLRNFHTALYTCTPEFQAVSWQYIRDLSMSMLIPFLTLSLLGVLILWLRRLSSLQQAFSFPQVWCWWKQKRVEEPEFERQTLRRQPNRPLLSVLEPELVYNICLLMLFVAMALMAMRLKLFLTPHMCILVSLLASDQVMGLFVDIKSRKSTRYILLTVVIAVMCKPGYKYLSMQQNVSGEYSNYPLEELLIWVEKSTPANAAFAGPMPTMANLLLSTGRPIVNHPHYEDANLRHKTEMVYSVFSRKTPNDVFLRLQQLSVNYVVLSSTHCFERVQSRKGCKMTDIWDLTDPENRSRPPLCPQLFLEEPPPHPFERVFRNEEYAVLKISLPKL